MSFPISNPLTHKYDSISRYFPFLCVYACVCVSECDKYIQSKSSMSVSSALQCSRKLNEREPWLKDRQWKVAGADSRRKRRISIKISYSTESKTRIHWIQWSKCTNIALKMNGRKRNTSQPFAMNKMIFILVLLWIYLFLFSSTEFSSRERFEHVCTPLITNNNGSRSRSSSVNTSISAATTVLTLSVNSCSGLERTWNSCVFLLLSLQKSIAHLFGLRTVFSETGKQAKN